MNGVKICEKYVIRPEYEKINKSNKKSVKISRLIEDQFRLHVDTDPLRRNSFKIKPMDVISVTAKLHGTSFVVGKVLVSELSWKNKLAMKLSKIPTPTHKLFKRFNLYFNNFIHKLATSKSEKTIYDTIYASRTVIKNGSLNSNPQHYYDYDIWGDIKNKLEDSILKGITLYGEAVGYLPTGAAIQKRYHYGCAPNTYETYIYRITYTNCDGKHIEFSWPQVVEYCKKYNLKTVPTLYYGYAKDLYPDLDPSLHWNDSLVERLDADEAFGMNDVMCKYNNFEVPSEGVVVKVDQLFDCEPLKLKNFKFLQKESEALDKGESDIETEQSFGEENEADRSQ